MLPALCAAMDWPKNIIRPRATIGTISNIAIFILSIYNRSYKMLVLYSLSNDNAESRRFHSITIFNATQPRNLC